MSCLPTVRTFLLVSLLLLVVDVYPAHYEARDITGQALDIKPLHRHKRQTVDYYIDILPVVDNAIWTTALEKANNNAGRAKDDLLTYFENILAGAAMRFRTLDLGDRALNIRMLQPYILQNGTDRPYPPEAVEEEGGKKQLNATALLYYFRDWVRNRPALPAHDHAIFFTSVDIYGGSDSAIQFTITKGLALQGGMCKSDGSSVSVIEDKGAYQSEGVVAHELGHSLGAKHDGSGNACLSSDRYLMSDTTYTETAQNMLNPWSFSSCSSDYIRSFLETLEANASIKELCLERSLGQPTGDIVPKTSDEQCRAFYGHQSFTCREKDISDICHLFYCRNPGTENCERMHTASGTCCGNGKYCIGGECMPSENGTCVMDELCPLGDQPGVIDDGKTCGDFHPAFCYTWDFRDRCCDTCRQLREDAPGCPYGDKDIGCQPEKCSDQFSSGPFTTNMSVAFVCCKTCTEAHCVDQSVQLTYGGQEYLCHDLIITQKEVHLCYRADAQKTCCVSCEEERDPDDKVCPWQDQEDCDLLWDYPLGYQCTDEQLSTCCRICALLETRTSSTAPSTALTTRQTEQSLAPEATSPPPKLATPCVSLLCGGSAIFDSTVYHLLLLCCWLHRALW